MIVSNESAHVCTVSANSRCSTLNLVSINKPDMPMIPFMGVRISWLMLARNSLLVLEEIRAASRARASSHWMWRRTRNSRKIRRCTAASSSESKMVSPVET